MSRRIDPRLVRVTLFLALPALVWLFVRFLDDEELESPLKPRSEASSLSGDDSGTGIRRNAGANRRFGRGTFRESDEWEPLDETEAEKAQVPVHVRLRIAETGKPLDGADVSLLASKEQIYRRLIHGRRDEPGLYFFRLPRDYTTQAIRVQNGPPHDSEGAFVPGHYYAPPREVNEGLEFDIAVSQAPAISGVVVDAASGLALPGAEVLAHGGHPRRPWKTTSNDQGVFALRALQENVFDEPATFLDLDVRARGHVSRHLAVALAPGQNIVENLVIALEPALHAAGVILDDRGSPCADLELKLLVALAGGRAPARSVEAVLETTTDEGGRFDFSEVAGNRNLELRVEAEGFLPGRFAIPALDQDRHDLRFALQRGVMVGLDLVLPNGAAVVDQVVRVFSRDDRGDWYQIGLDVLSERREIPLPLGRRSEIVVFAQVQTKGWFRGSCIIDPSRNLDRATVALEAFGDERVIWGSWALERDCRWGVHVVVKQPSASENLSRVLLGSGYYSEDVDSFDGLTAPGGILEYRAIGAAPQRYLITAAPGSELNLELRTQAASRPDRR